METQNKFYETIKLIDKILESEFEEGNYRKIIELIKQDFSIQEYFFKTLNNPNWFLPLYSDGFFTPNSIPPPIEEKGVYIYPYWYSLTYLKSVAAHSEHKDYDEIADGLIKVITYVSLKLQQSSDNYRIGFGLLEILLNIPNQFIPIEVLSFISNWINNDYRFTPFDSDLCEKLLPKFLKENLPKNDYLKGEEIFKHIFTVIPEKILEDSNIIFLSSKHFKSVIDLYYIEDAFIRKKLTQKIGEYCSLVPIFHLSDEIKTIFDDPHKDPIFWSESLIKEPTYSYGGVAKVFTSVLKEILIAKGKKNADEIKIVIEKYLTQEYAQSIFKRLIFFLIYNFWDDLHSYFWKLLKDTSAVNYLLEFSYANETYPILKKYGQKFTLDEKQNIEKIVEHGINVKYNEPKDQEYYRYRIYSSFAGDSYFDSKINELKDKLNYTDLKESREETSGVLTSDTRSFMALELFQKSNKEIIDFLKAYKPVKFEDIPIYTYADQLQNSIAENPNKFISSLLEFNILQLTYISRIILGFKDAWNRNNLFDWEILLNFINEFISTKKFAENAFIIEEQFPKVTREWVIASIGELIQVGTQDDIKAFDVRLIPKAMSILDNLSQYIQKEESLPDGRYVDHPLNSPFGRLITAIIYTALRKARVEYKDKDVQKIKWDEKTKSIYQNILNKPNIDGFILFGFYLNQFHFLDYYWTNSEIDQIHKMENDLWTGFMSAYTFRSNFNQDLYLKMRPNYEKAIKKNFNSVSEHIGVAIIWEIEKYEKGSLLEYFLRNCTPAAISELIHFFSKNEEYIKGMKKNEIILNLWETIFTSLKIKSGDQLNSTIAGLARLMSFTDEINEKIKLLLEESIKFMKEGFLSSELIEELVRIIKTKLNKQTAKDIGELYLKLLDISTPTHKQDHIIELINTLYSFDDRELDLISNEIANIYGTRGLYFLKDLYFEHN